MFDNIGSFWRVDLTMPTPMDRETFLARAPLTYALAIVEVLRNANGDVQTSTLSSYFRRDEDEPDLLENVNLIQLACEWLQERGLINLIKMDFGPDLIEASENYREEYGELCLDRSLPFYAHSRVEHKLSLVKGMLIDLLEQEGRLKITGDDFQPIKDQWAPLALDRVGDLVERATAASSDALSQIEGSNGYADQFPQERAYVVSGLHLFVDRLRSRVDTSRKFIEDFGLRLLEIARPRFEKAAEAVTIQAAIVAVKELLRAFGFHLP